MADRQADIFIQVEKVHFLPGNVWLTQRGLSSISNWEAPGSHDDIGLVFWANVSFAQHRAATAAATCPLTSEREKW